MEKRPSATWPGSRFRQRLARYRERYPGLIPSSLFFLFVLYYEELFLKLYCFHAIRFSGAIFTLLFLIPPALLLGLLCSAVSVRTGRILLPICTAVLSLWLGAQTIYYHLFKIFLTLFSLSKMGMVAGAFGDMAVLEILANWFPVLMMAMPVVVSCLLSRLILRGEPIQRGAKIWWAVQSVLAYGIVLGIVALCGGGVLSIRDIYFRSMTPELETREFGMIAQTQLDVQRLIFGIPPEVGAKEPEPTPELQPDSGNQPVILGENVMDIDFEALMQRDWADRDLVEMHRYFSNTEPTNKNSWTGRFEEKNLVWIVAEGFCTLAMDPDRTPMLWKLSHEGIVCDNFYTPLWGVSTSDGEYVTTTGLVPKSGVWSYSLSAANDMPFGFGNQFRKLGYRTLAYHDYLYDYYDRNLSHPNMGFDYYALDHGLEMEEIWPPSDQEMMEKIVPQFVNEDSFMVYCLTVSGHLKYSFETNTMSERHRDAVEGLNYSEPVQAYLACQMELELAIESLVEQLEAAGKLDDTVIVLTGDHYPYGLTDEEYSELLGHEVDPVFEIFKNTLILWSSDIEEPVHVDKYCSSLDVMPTLANLFGLEYDSRLMAGRDILSDSPGLVIFSNYSFLNQEGAYNSIADTFTTWDGKAVDEASVQEWMTEVHNRVAYSAAILDKDYYRVVFGNVNQENPVE